jgi:hypothetical protein
MAHEIAVSHCTESTSCNCCGTATYTRFGQAPELPVDAMVNIAIAHHNMKVVTRLCPECAYTLEVALRTHREQGR